MEGKGKGVGKSSKPLLKKKTRQSPKKRPEPVPLNQAEVPPPPPRRSPPPPRPSPQRPSPPHPPQPESSEESNCSSTPLISSEDESVAFVPVKETKSPNQKKQLRMRQFLTEVSKGVRQIMEQQRPKRSFSMSVPLGGGSDIIACAKPGEISLGTFQDAKYKETMRLSLDSLSGLDIVSNIIEDFFQGKVKEHQTTILKSASVETNFEVYPDRGVFFLERDAEQNILSHLQFSSFEMFTNFIIALRSLLISCQCFTLEQIEFTELLTDQLLQKNPDEVRNFFQIICTDGLGNAFIESKKFVNNSFVAMSAEHQFCFIKAHRKFLSVYYSCHILYNDLI